MFRDWYENHTVFDVGHHFYLNKMVLVSPHKQIVNDDDVEEYISIEEIEN